MNQRTRRSARPEVDPLEHRIEAVLEPGHFISWGDRHAFVHGLEAVEREIAGLVPTAAQRATALYETFLAGCHAKVEEVDDDGVDLGLFVRTLYCGWLQAHRAAGAAPEESARTVLGWMEKDEYNLSAHVEDDLVSILDDAEVRAFERAIRERWAGAGRGRDRWAGFLRSLFVARRDVRGYLFFCEQTETTAKDCLQIPRLLQTERSAEEALFWVERGLELDRQGRGYESVCCATCSGCCSTRWGATATRSSRRGWSSRAASLTSPTRS